MRCVCCGRVDVVDGDVVDVVDGDVGCRVVWVVIKGCRLSAFNKRAITALTHAPELNWLGGAPNCLRRVMLSREVRAKTCVHGASAAVLSRSALKGGAAAHMLHGNGFGDLDFYIYKIADRPP